MGEISHKTSDMSVKEKDAFIKTYDNRPKIKKFQKDLIDSTINPFDKLEISKKAYRYSEKQLHIKPDCDDIYNNYNKFLKKIKKMNYKNILVVAHSGTLGHMMHILCNISLENDLINMSNGEQVNNVPNCSFMCVQYDSEKDKYELVSKPDNFHIKGLQI